MTETEWSWSRNGCVCTVSKGLPSKCFSVCDPSQNFVAQTLFDCSTNALNGNGAGVVARERERGERDRGPEIEAGEPRQATLLHERQHRVERGHVG